MLFQCPSMILRLDPDSSYPKHIDSSIHHQDSSQKNIFLKFLSTVSTVSTAPSPSGWRQNFFDMKTLIPPYKPYIIFFFPDSSSNFSTNSPKIKSVALNFISVFWNWRNFAHFFADFQVAVMHGGTLTTIGTWITSLSLYRWYILRMSESCIAELVARYR